MRLFLFLSALPLVACGGSPCQKFVDKAVSCKQMSDKGAEKATEQCDAESKDAAKGPANAKVTACAEKADCDGFVSCTATVSVETDMEKSVKSGDWGMAGYQCKDAKGDDLKAACAKLYDTAIPAMTAAVEKQRDAGDDSGTACIDLSLLAEKKSPEAKAAADTLCAELSAAKYAKKCEDAAAADVTANKPEYPFDCSMAQTSLDKIGSDWSKSRSESMNKTLVLGLGKLSMKATVPTMKYVCEGDVQPYYDAVKKYAITDADIDPLMVKAAALCDKPAAR